MIQGKDIVYFSNDWDADNRTSSHHIARQIARNNRLLYVESSGLRSPNASARDVKKIFRKICKALYGIRRIDENTFVYSPMLLPFHKFKVIQWINKHMLVHSLRNICKKLKFEHPILWIIIPHMFVVAGSLNEKLRVYYCVDDFSSLPGVDPDSVAQFDTLLTKEADIIFTPSEPLYRKKKEINVNTFLSPHGVDIEHFSKALKEGLSIPDDMAVIKKPIIGFFGLIEKWIDLELIKYIARMKPEWSIVLIGRVAQDISGFSSLSNVHFLGAKPYGSLPCYAKAFNVAVIPYVLNNQVFNANPIKLREYLSMGKPVVSVRTPEVEKFADVVKISDTYDDFVSNITQALKETSEQCVKQRTEKVKDSSWDKRFERISDIVNQALEKKRLF